MSPPQSEFQLTRTLVKKITNEMVCTIYYSVRMYHVGVGFDGRTFCVMKYIHG